MRLAFSDVSKTYPNGFQALSGVTMEIERGLHGLLGPNGAGKTTLMKIACTLLEPSSGSVTVDGVPLAQDRRTVRERLGYLGQDWGAPRQARCDEVLDLMLRLRTSLDGKRREAEITTLLELVGLQHSRRAKVKTLSGGMLRRLGVAQALAGSPEVIVMDEPTVGLDPNERVEFRNLLTHLGRERTILLSTHIVADVGNTCSRVTVLARGSVMYDGPPRDLAERARGHVFETTIPANAEAEAVAAVQAVVVTTQVAGGLRLRTIGRPPDRFGPVPAEPTLEDAYLLLVPASTGEVAWTA